MHKHNVCPEILLRIICLLTWILIFSGCHRTTCPGYPDEYMKWIPYTSASKILFTDGSETIMLRVGETFRSEPYEASSWILEPFCDVNATASISGDTALPEIMIRSMYINDPVDEADYIYTIEGNTIRDADYNILYAGWADFSFQVREDEISVYFPHTVSLMASYFNGYKEYYNVLKLENDTALNYYKPWVYQVYIAENIGVIQFRELKNKKVWSLIEE